jgi:hypothetical protein
MFVTFMAFHGVAVDVLDHERVVPWTRISIARRIASTTTWGGLAGHLRVGIELDHLLEPRPAHHHLADVVELLRPFPRWSPA